MIPGKFFDSTPRIARWLGRLVDGCLHVAVFLVPLLFLPFTVDVLELGKQSLLIVLATVGLLAWLGQALIARRFQLSRSWMHFVVLFFIVGYALTAYFSQDRYLSLVGNFGQMQWPFLSILAFGLLYFLIVNTIRGTTKLYHLILTFLASSSIVGILGLAQMTGHSLLGWLSPTLQSQAFTTIGSYDAFGVYLTIPLILAASLTVLGCKDAVCILGQEGRRSWWAKALVWVTMVIGLIAAIVIDYWVIWATILFGTALLVLIPFLRSRRIAHPTKLVIPGVLVVVSILLLLFNSPLALRLPAEVVPSLSASWNIARLTLQEHPLLGSGPGTWIFDYAHYRSVAVNVSQFWSIRFDRGISTFLSLFAMIGLVGMGLWVILVVSGVVKSAHHLVTERNDDAWQAYLTVFTAWATTVFIAFFYNYNFSHHFVFWFLLALLASLVADESWTWDMRSSAGWSAAVSFVFLFACIGLISGLWMIGERLAADAEYAKAVAVFQAGKPIQGSVDALLGATALNPWNDSYERNLSQAYLIRAGQELQNTKDTDSLKRGNETVGLAVDAAKKATDLSSSNVDNWSNFATVLESITSFTRGADEQAIKMFGEATMREPNNPVYSAEIGRIHVLRADAYRQLLQSTDAKVKADAQQHIQDELDQAAQFLNQSIQMKPDYAPAHYALGIVYEREGRLPDAINKLEQVLRADPKNVGVAFQLALLYAEDKLNDKSMNLFEQIVAFDPNYSNARWYLSVLYEQKGRYDEAIAQVQKVKELNPDNATIDQRLALLKQERDTKAHPPGTALPEPVKEEVNGPQQVNQVKRP